MNSVDIDSILACIRDAGDVGASKKEAIRATRLTPKRFDSAVKTLKAKGEIVGPVRTGRKSCFFTFEAAARRESMQNSAACQAVEAVIRASGTKLLSNSALQKKLPSALRSRLSAALSTLISARKIMSLKCGRSLVHLHRESAAAQFQFEVATPVANVPETSLKFEQVLVAYEQLKREQRGIETVTLLRLARTLEANVTALHDFIRVELPNGRLFIYPATTVNLPAEEMAAAYRIPGHRDPYVTLAIREFRA